MVYGSLLRTTAKEGGQELIGKAAKNAIEATDELVDVGRREALQKAQNEYVQATTDAQLAQLRKEALEKKMKDTTGEASEAIGKEIKVLDDQLMEAQITMQAKKKAYDMTRKLNDVNMSRLKKGAGVALVTGGITIGASELIKHLDQEEVDKERRQCYDTCIPKDYDNIKQKFLNDENEVNALDFKSFNELEMQNKYSKWHDHNEDDMINYFTNISNFNGTNTTRPLKCSDRDFLKYDENGNQIRVNNEGKEIKIDENGNELYKKDSEGNVIYIKDKEGNDTIIPEYITVTNESEKRNPVKVVDGCGIYCKEYCKQKIPDAESFLEQGADAVKDGADAIKDGADAIKDAADAALSFAEDPFGFIFDYLSDYWELFLFILLIGAFALRPK